MKREPLTMICYADISGQLRGKGFPTRHLAHRLERGIGWTPTNLQIMALGGIADTAWGPRGDLVLMPDPATEVAVDFEDGTAPERFFLADVRETDGTPWTCCPRGFLKGAVAALAEAGLVPHVAIEQEFVYTGAHPRHGDGYTLDAVRRHGPFGEAFLAALVSAGIEPECYLPEFGAGQFEVTLPPGDAVTAADRAVIVRELARGTAFRLGHRAVFSPMLTEDGMGNGLHVHISLRDQSGRPITHDPDSPHGLAAVAGSFAAGIAHHMPALCAVTAPLPISYLRLRPHRWSATYNNVAVRDREAGLRICPVFGGADHAAEQCNIEYRPADAAANTYLQLGMILRAGLEGVLGDLPLPEPTTQDPDRMPTALRRERGLERLPTSLPEALERLAADPGAAGWMPPDLAEAYARYKRSELTFTKSHSFTELCAMYAEVY